MKNLIISALLALTGTAAFAAAVDAGTVDFSKPNGRLKRQLHCSGVTPRLGSRNINNYSDEFRRLRFTATRTHDLSLVDSNQRVIDTHHIFPLFHLDEQNPDNYFFTATDALLTDIMSHGPTVFYRMGTSIEHALPGAHINTVPPPNNAKYARVLEHIIRHYNYGWGKNGMQLGIQYWEIWNEAELGKDEQGNNLNGTCWDGSMKEFHDFFATVATHLKSKFPELKIGGPAFAWFGGQIEPFLKDMAARRVPLDFVSWHDYNKPLDDFVRDVAAMRRLLDTYGYTDTELIQDEWHYLGEAGWAGVGHQATGVGTASDIALLERRHSIDGVWGVNSAAYNTALVTRLHDTALDWSFHYGCGYDGNWGLWDIARQPHRNYYSMLMLGDIINDFPNRVAAKGTGSVHLLAGKSTDGKAALLVSDFRGTAAEIAVTVKGLTLPKTFEIRRIDAENKYKIETLTLTSETLKLAKPAADKAASAVWLLVEK